LIFHFHEIRFSKQDSLKNKFNQYLEDSMKKLIILACAALLILPMIPMKAQAGQFGDLLVELETSVNFSSQTDQWRARRSGWISQVRSAGDDLGALKRLLIEFETNVKYDAQVSNWRNRRNAWLSRVNGAGSLNQLANLMIEVETSINYSAQTSSWRTQRAGWLSRSRSVR